MSEQKICLQIKKTRKNRSVADKFFELHQAATINAPSADRVYLNIKEVAGSLYGEAYSDKTMNNDSNVGIINISLTDELVDGVLFPKTADIRKMLNDGNYTVHPAGFNGSNMILLLEEGYETLEEDEIEVDEVMDEAKTKMDEKELEERIEYLKAHGITKEDELTKNMFYKILQCMYYQDEEHKVSKPKKLYIHVTAGESLIVRMLRNIILGDPVILEGPKSCGKNVAWESISWLLNRPLEILNCSGKMTKAEMFGSPTTDNSAKSKITLAGAKAFFKSLFSKKENDEACDFINTIANCMSPSIKLDEGPVTRALLSAKEHGTILIADELNLSDPNTFAGAFNALTDKHTTYYSVNGLGVVEIPKGLIIGGTQNGTGGSYIGTKQQNDATMSRFNVIRLTAPDTIAKVLKENKFPNVTEDDINTLDRVYAKFAEAKRAGTVGEQALNVRGFERCLSHISEGQEILEAIKECVIYSCKASEEALLIAEAEGQIE